MKKILNKKIVSLFLGILLVVTTGIGVVYALNTWDTGYRINNGTTNSTVYYAGTSNSKLVTNNSGFNLFVPTKTTAEMNSFCNNGPSGTSCANNITYVDVGHDRCRPDGLIRRWTSRNYSDGSCDIIESGLHSCSACTGWGIPSHACAVTFYDNSVSAANGSCNHPSN